MVYDRELLQRAKNYATLSPDPRTQCGAVIVGKEGEQLSYGYNTLPLYLARHPSRLERPFKYSFIEHAERKAIYRAARLGIVLAGSTMYINIAPCVDCARAIIESGIRRVVHGPPEGGKTYGKWFASVALANEMLNEAEIEVTILEDE